MKQWEVYKLELPIGPHYVVVISGNATCSNLGVTVVNVLLCSTVRGTDRLSPTEAGLDSEDGLEHLTGCQCHSFLTIKKDRFSVPPVGAVTLYRRDDIKRKVRAAFNL